MSDFIALFTLIAGAAGSLLTLIITLSFQGAKDRRESRERLVQDLLPHRIEAHQDVLRTVAKLRLDELAEDVLDIEGMKRLMLASRQAIQTLTDLVVRTRLFSDNDVFDLLDKLGELIDNLMGALIEHDPRGSAAAGVEIRRAFRSSYQQLVALVIEMAREKSGVNLLEAGLAQAAKTHQKAIGGRPDTDQEQSKEPTKDGAGKRRGKNR